MFGQAAMFALLAAISPTALLVMAAYLGSAEPRRTAGLYLAGAIAMSTVMAVALLIIVRSIGLQLPSLRTPRYGMRLGLGIIALAAAGFVARHSARPAPAAGLAGSVGKQNTLISRLVTAPSPRTAFLAGVLLFAPSVAFVAAVQVVATASAGIASTATGLVIIVAISVIMAWLPLLTYILRPDATARRLKAINGWLHRQGRRLVVLALAVGGLLLVLNGTLGLVG